MVWKKYFYYIKKIYWGNRGTPLFLRERNSILGSNSYVD